MPKWLKWTLTVVIFIGLTAGLYFIGFKGDWIQPLVTKAGWFGYILYVLLQILITTLLCFVPATTFTFTLMSVQIFGVVTGLILSIIGCWLSSIGMFLVGRYGGTRLVDWLIGKEQREKTQEMISDRAVVLLPVMLACPFFPDDALCMVAGMTKINIWYFIVMSLFTRSIGIVATGLLGNNATINYIKAALGNNIVLWVIVVNVILIDVYAIWKLSGLLEKWLRKRRENKALKVAIEKENNIIEENKENTVELETSTEIIEDEENTHIKNI